ncbi:hypothetical protein SAMN05216345_101895 [Cupriavidus sp. YR651]|uniref:hypothetical protein n=1 Tax=Cupriavidus sp. YR651 TaxID=1855315 RepID=UPI00088B0FEA|nr:hypothetical protein [Cupriavidus sp. YR651]SDC19939.1 hypothetical protein SAMN05216345_101895 [Cupriavidus sp. YR651]
MAVQQSTVTHTRLRLASVLGSQDLQRVERAAKQRDTAPWLAAHGHLALRQVRSRCDFVIAQLTAPTPFAFGLTTGRMLFATGPYREALAVDLTPIPPEWHDLATERAELHWNGLDEAYLDTLSVGREMGSLANLVESHQAAPDDFALGLVTAWILCRIQIHNVGTKP